MENEIKEKLVQILGKDAYNGNMQVSSDVSKLSRAVNYLTTQLIITGRWIEDSDGKDHIQKVIESTKEILS